MTPLDCGQAVEAEATRVDRRKTLTDRVCRACGRMFKPRKAITLFCSRACFRADEIQRAAARRAASTLQLTCARCGTGFTRYVCPANRADTYYCTNACVVDAQRGPAHVGWRGNAAGVATGRKRARKAFALGPCERCGVPATDRHHIDGDTFNNVASNIAILCRRCHMAIDGRLVRNLSPGRRGGRPRPVCVVCGLQTSARQPARHGRCPCCDVYLRKHGVERPARLWEKSA